MRATGIELTDLSNKWGLVTIFAGEQVALEYTVSAKVMRLLQSSNNLMPPGCTFEQWRNGQVVITGRPLNVGQGFVNPNGSLMVTYGVDRIGGRVVIKRMLVPATDWQLIGGVVNMLETLADQLDVAHQVVHEATP